MKKSYLTILRDKNTDMAAFRLSADKLAALIASECAASLQECTKTVETSFAKTTGYIPCRNIILVPILRSGLVLLNGFLSHFSFAKVGILGMKREEKTAKPIWYYENLPAIHKNDRVFILDPMIATGGSSLEAIKKLIKKKVPQKNISLIGIIASEEGIKAIKKSFPQITIKVVAIDKKLNKEKFIVPGLGDFGDRYFGTL